MDETLGKPFTKAEMDAMRQKASQEASGDDARLQQTFWTKVMRVGRQLPFAEDLVAAYYCMVDPATPRRVKLILIGAIAYFVLPTDAVPDLLPFLGFADDAAMLATAIAQVAGAIGDTHREKARAALKAGED
jgi:uncharacterized membrane protein YkvA (DUF1232 family)